MFCQSNEESNESNGKAQHTLSSRIWVVMYFPVLNIQLKLHEILWKYNKMIENLIYFRNRMLSTIVFMSRRPNMLPQLGKKCVTTCWVITSFKNWRNDVLAVNSGYCSCTESFWWLYICEKCHWILMGTIFNL